MFLLAAVCLALLLGAWWLWCQVRDVHEIFPPEQDE